MLLLHSNLTKNIASLVYLNVIIDYYSPGDLLFGPPGRWYTKLSTTKTNRIQCVQLRKITRIQIVKTANGEEVRLNRLLHN